MADQPVTSQYITFKVRAYPTRKQHERLGFALDYTRKLYNAALEERISYYRVTGKSMSYAEQSRSLTEIRKYDPEAAGVWRRFQVYALQCLDRSYKGFFTRHKKGAKGRQIGFPKFRGYEYWNTIGTSDPACCKMTDRGLVHNKAFGGTLRLRPHRPLPPGDRLCSWTMTRDGRRWFIHLVYETEIEESDGAPRCPVGLDLGLKTHVMRSDGVPMQSGQSFRDAESELRVAQRHLSRCKRRSNRRRKAKAHVRRIHAKINRRRKHDLHRISARLVHHFDAVAVEDLNLRGLTRMGNKQHAGRGMRKKWRDIAPGTLIELLEWKAKRDGRPFRKVDPRGTTIECADCGARVEKELKQRTHSCPECGVVRDRDWNAALNVLDRAGWGPAGAKREISVGLGPSAVPVCLRNTSPLASDHGNQGSALVPPSILTREKVVILATGPGGG